MQTIFWIPLQDQYWKNLRLTNDKTNAADRSDMQDWNPSACPTSPLINSTPADNMFSDELDFNSTFKSWIWTYTNRNLALYINTRLLDAVLDLLWLTNKVSKILLFSRWDHKSVANGQEGNFLAPVVVFRIRALITYFTAMLFYQVTMLPTRVFRNFNQVHVSSST